MLAAASMQTAIVESAGPVYQAVHGRRNYLAAAATPMTPFQIYLGHLLFMVFRVVISSLAFVLVMAAFGLVHSPLAALGLLLGSALTGTAFAAPMAAWAVAVRRPTALDICFRFILMPLYMLSGTFFSIRQLPSWLQDLAWITPLWHGVDLCRTLGLGTATAGTTAIHLGYLLALVAAGIAAARVTYRRALHG